MLRRLFAERRCPVCGGPVTKEPRKTDGGDVAMMAIPELPFWVLFGLCTVVGAWDWIAAGIGFLGVGAIFLAYGRSRSRYKCRPCESVFPHSKLAVPGSARSDA